MTFTKSILSGKSAKSPGMFDVLLPHPNCSPTAELNYLKRPAACCSRCLEPTRRTVASCRSVSGPRRAASASRATASPSIAVERAAVYSIPPGAQRRARVGMTPEALGWNPNPISIEKYLNQ